MKPIFIALIAVWTVAATLCGQKQVWPCLDRRSHRTAPCPTPQELFQGRRRKYEGKSTIKPNSEACIQANGLHDHLLLKGGEEFSGVAVFVPKGMYPKGGMLNTASSKSAVIKI